MLTEKEERIVIALRQKPSRKILHLANDLGLPKSTVFEMLKKLQKQDVIHNQIRVNFEQVGFPIKTFLILKSTPSGRTTLEDFLRQSKNVNTLHRVNTNSDFHVEAIFPNQKEALDYLEGLDGLHVLLGKQVFNAIESIHDERFLSSKEHFERWNHGQI